jgi:hypothetical protein
MDGFMTTRRRWAPALLLCLAPAAVFADDFRWEVRGSFDRSLDSGYLAEDTDVLALSGTWFFEPVSTDAVPLAEAAFLGRASSLGAVVGRLDVFDTHLDAQAVNVSYYFPGDLFYASVVASRGEYITGLSSTMVVTEHDTSLSGKVGIAPLEGLLITTDLREQGYDPNITARHVGKLPNGRFYAGSVSVIDPDLGDTSFGLDFDYYFDESVSLGVGYEDADDQWQVRAEKFFGESWAVGASASTNDYGDGIGISVSWRH